ncbi:MAG: 2-C-methyl-D-erythritol 4-phosphate cytidylyltransferase [Deltaproteobacteria bacterium]|nr:2-C-methyl-D-erythritol 4-phosphate cytidylyltransferase [Deltaproteobacteria bacterium]
MMVQSVAIIVAGGSGKRMSYHIPKQYLLLDGIPILGRTLIKFEKASSVGRIVLVVPKDDMDYVRDEITDKYRIFKVKHIQAGGETRQDSVRNGLEMVDDRDDVIVIHDGVRPFLSEKLIDLSIQEAARSGAVIPVIPLKNTVKIVDEDGIIRETPGRHNLRLAQTPQAFKREIILEAYKSAYKEGFYGTDDASLVECMGGSVKTIPGSHDNIKITTPEDLALGELLLKKIGSGR